MSIVEEGKTEAEAVAEIADSRNIATQVVSEDGRVAWLKRGADEFLEVVDGQVYESNPRRATGGRRLNTEQSFAAYVIAHGTKSLTHIYCDEESLLVEAVLNDHQRNIGDAADSSVERAPGWGDFSALLQYEHGRAWNAWVNISDEWMSQDALIDLLEDRVSDVLDPPETQLLDIARSFSAHKAVTFSSARNLSNGQVELTYNERVEQHGPGQIVVPERIELALDPIKGDDPVRVKARLRWRISDDKGLQMMVKLDRLDEILEAAWTAVVARMAAHLGDFLVLEGTA